jgi:hypothetical protein
MLTIVWQSIKLFMSNGFSQVEGIDFNERFPPIAWLKLIEAMFVVVTI